MNKVKLKQDVVQLFTHLRDYVQIPIGISNRHIHLSKEDFELLFPGQEVNIMKELTQPGFYAAHQTVTIVGSKGELHKVRLLTPLRKQTQVELSATDARTIGVRAPIRLSGQLADATDIIIKSDFATITRPAAIIAKRHIHMNPTDAKLLGLALGDKVSVVIDTPERRTIYDDVIIRPSEGAVFEMHIDTDEANAANCGKESVAYFLK
ncbi:phosphate propanoyltransferase [Streptococcus massiliensis]|uniref:Phosphate propanoyltransferase n=1 Tax=Streptococcus massiliensis TaxID=313439 RepID=A0A380L0Y4_9STRE|nr:phosphate propanoyltransferase [Streptococcus massiliensis]SUN77240.1 propanediol utilization protein [Streptococcus massiliensis]